MLLCVPVMVLLVFIAVELAVGLFWYMPRLARRIIGEVRAGALVRSALDDEFGPPPPVAVQGGRHRGLHLVQESGPLTRRVIAFLFQSA